MARKELCYICGAEGADILCSRCGRIVCEECYDPDTNSCVRCSAKAWLAESRGSSRPGLMMAGLALLFLGMIVTTIALLPPSGEGEGFVFIFPFFFVGGVGGWASILLTAIFLGFFLLSFFLPWYMASKRSGPYEGYFEVKSGNVLRTNSSETMEYMITTELPRQLRKTIYIEADGGSIRLRSKSDDSFEKSYALPEGFEVEEINYEYDDDYLLLKLLLVRER